MFAVLRHEHSELEVFKPVNKLVRLVAGGEKEPNNKWLLFWCLYLNSSFDWSTLSHAHLQVSNPTPL